MPVPGAPRLGTVCICQGRRAEVLCRCCLGAQRQGLGPILLRFFARDSQLSSIAASTAAALALVSQDMQGMDAVIEQRLASDVPLVGHVSRYIVAAGGKRLRPALLLLMCGALGCRSEQRLNLAAVVEFIHTATLLHDDVVD